MNIIIPDQVEPIWLTSVLRRNGIAPDTEVSKVRVILSRELPVSTVHRLSIEYKDKTDDREQPRSLFLKLGEPIKNGYEPENIGRREVEFYKEVAPGMGCPPLVRCYDAAFEEETGRSHILLEDLTETHTQPEQQQAPSEEMSRRAVQALAKVHARWWKSPHGDGEERRRTSALGKDFDEHWLKNFVEDLNASVHEFKRIAGLSAAQEEAYRLMLEAAPGIWGRLTKPNGLTVTHGDVHWWNFLYPREPATHSVHVIDWHLWHIDLGARDLAFLLALGGFAEPRPQIEQQLLRVYHDGLGVDGYSFDRLMDDYRLSAVRNLNIPVIFWKQGKHESTWRTALQRGYEAFVRLGCEDLLR